LQGKWEGRESEEIFKLMVFEKQPKRNLNGSHKKEWGLSA
jgi:hypothetical protein